MKTIDVKFYNLCDEIDYWKERVEKAEADAKYWRDEYLNRINENLASAQKGITNALMFALSIRDDENGNLIIDKEERKILADNWK
jgi:hypothetical protein